MTQLPMSASCRWTKCLDLSPHWYLKNSVEDKHVHDEKTEDEEEAEETRQEHREKPKQKRTKTQIPVIHFSTLNPKTDVDVHYVPCVNGICRRGSIITLSGIDFKVKDFTTVRRS